MAQRTSRQQGKHDAGVKASAEYYEKQGYQVLADIPGYHAPPTIGGRRPDVVAKKGKEEVVVEVETKDNDKADADQQATFKQYADSHTNTRFRKKVV